MNIYIPIIALDINTYIGSCEKMSASLIVSVCITLKVNVSTLVTYACCCHPCFHASLLFTYETLSPSKQPRVKLLLL